MPLYHELASCPNMHGADAELRARPVAKRELRNKRKVNVAPPTFWSGAVGGISRAPGR